MNTINYLRVHFPGIAAGVVTVLTILQETDIISLNAKWFTALNALLLAFGLTVVHVRQQAVLKLQK